MNKKGFTLVELLAVIVLVSVVALIGTTSIAGVRKKINKKMFETKLDLVIAAAKDYGADHSGKFDDSCWNGTNTGCINETVEDLIINKYFESDEGIEVNYNNNKYTYKTSNSECTVVGYTSDNKYYCPALINPVDNKVYNDIYVYIYKSNNRIKACFYQSSNIVFNDYKSNYFCS